MKSARYFTTLLGLLYYFFQGTTAQIGGLFPKKCIEDLGCFSTGPPFYHKTIRPDSLLPCVPEVRFQLYTPSNPKDPYDLEITLESLQNSSFKSELPMKFLIHGFRSDLGPGDIRHKIRAALLKHEECNVIIVNWTKNNGMPYEQAVANTRSTGAKAAKLIHFLMNNTGITPQSIHIIGHSLGGHMAGYIGERVPNIGRITGLDPAGPLFQGLDPKVCLDPTDALFVDIIHSDGGELVLNGFGTSGPVGHMDFYPNSGRGQPGCNYVSEDVGGSGAVMDFATKWVANECNHDRANEYFLESIDNSKCRFLAVRCSSYKDYENGMCPPENSTVAEMGYHLKQMKLKFPAKFYLKTKGSSPYCIQNR